MLCLCERPHKDRNRRTGVGVCVSGDTFLFLATELSRKHGLEQALQDACSLKGQGSSLVRHMASWIEPLVKYLGVFQISHGWLSEALKSSQTQSGGGHKHIAKRRSSSLSSPLSAAV